MCRRYKFDEWVALSAGDVPARKRTHMESHAPTCRGCSMAKAEAERLFGQASAFVAANANEPPVALRECTWAAVTAASFSEPTERKSKMPPFVFPWKPLLAVGGVACAATLSLVAPTLSPHTPAPVAFARVEAAMADVQTATWTETCTTVWDFGIRRDKKTSAETNTTVTQFWAQFDPVRMASRIVFEDSTARREGAPKLQQTIVVDGRHLLLQSATPANPDALLRYSQQDVTQTGSDFSSSPQQSLRDRLVQSLLFPREAGEQRAKRVDRTSPIGRSYTVRFDAWTSHPDRLGNTPVLRFETIQEYVYQPNTKKERHTKCAWKVWVDPNTYRIVRREISSLPSDEDTFTTRNIGRFTSRVVSENFKYNVPVPPQVFEVPRPPLNHWFSFNDLTREGYQNKSVTPEQKRAMERVVRQTIAAWNRRDSRSFLPLWDFGFFNRLPNIPDNKLFSSVSAAQQRQHWAARLQKGVPYQQWRVTAVYPADKATQNPLFVLRSENEAFPPTPHPERDVYRVNTRGLAVLKLGAAPSTVESEFQFSRGEDGQFHVVHIEMLKLTKQNAARQGARRAAREVTKTGS